MKLVVGLGNPGKEYQNTRHNVGFMVIEEIAKKCGFSRTFSNFKAEYYKEKLNGEDVIFFMPYTYMNLSGEAVRAIVDYYKIPLENIVVIHDDLDLPVGQVRLREFGGPGGHNGIKSIIQHLGSEKFKRVRIGISKNPLIPVVNYVLGKFTSEEKTLIDEGIIKARDAMIELPKTTFQRVMNKYNTKEKK